MGNARRGNFFAQRGPLTRLLALTSAALMVAVALVAVAPTAPAQALSGSQFQPGNIISDTEFYNPNAMTEAQIQAFLDAKIGACQNSSCLNVLRHTVPSKAEVRSTSTGQVRCGAFQGGTSLRASTIIYRAQAACGISAKVILVTLQKEQGLVLSKAPGTRALDRAMGMACPDTAPCASYALGFGNQVYMGALQLNTYQAAKFGMQPGMRTIGYHPSASCGASTFLVENDATAALYNYTPYRPNQAALNNLGGVGDVCSSYGNRNFWVFYSNWFGSPTILQPTAATARIDGDDRYEVAAMLAENNYPNAGVPVLYIATGIDFPDALSSASAAATLGGPLLLVRTDGIPASVKSQIVRLKPAQIVVTGGVGSVSEAVYNELVTLAPAIRRDAGEDRYETSRNIARTAFAGSTTAYIATGLTFADALSASAAAASVDAPVILVRGTENALDAETAALLTELGITSVSIAGGPGAVTPGIEAGLKALLGNDKVLRHGGADRYDVSGAINRHAFDTADTVYVAAGNNFPDALAGAAIAGAQSVPLYITRPTCLRKDLLQDIFDLGADKMVILGGTGALGGGMEKYTNCS